MSDDAICLAFVPDPPSAQIAAQLTAKDADRCEHGRNPCILRCGVEGMPELRDGAYVGPMQWTPIHPLVRQRWLASFDDQALDGMCDNPRHGLRYECGCRKP